LANVAVETETDRWTISCVSEQETDPILSIVDFYSENQVYDDLSHLIRDGDHNTELGRWPWS